MLKNIGFLIKEVKKHLEEYLNEHGIDTSKRLFKCPNHKFGHKHNDAKPSCNFYPDKTTFHCFACSYKSGDIFDAVHLLEGKDITGENFIEVLKYLCDKYNIPYEETTTEEEKFYNECREFLNKLVDTAHQNLLKELKNNKKLEDFLRSKHWYESIEHFKLGYFSKTPVLQVNREVLSYLNIKNMTSLVNRVVIPIYNYNGNIAGITLRNLSDSGPKYIHYLMYNVRNLLFNIHNINSNEIYVVEGPSSVITLHSFGINNVVATFGNHFHEKQYELLVKKKISKLTLLYDGDSGGLEGTRNSLETISRYDIDAYIAFLPDKLDPGDYVIQNGDLSNINTKPLIDYLTEQYKLNTSDKYIERCLMTYISSITDLVKKEETINLVSKQTKINKSTLTDLLDLYSKKLDSISISELLKERESLLVTLNEYEKWTWSRGQLLGLKSYKSFDNKLDGIQNGLILVGGVPNVGKCLVGDTYIFTDDGVLPISYYENRFQISKYPFYSDLRINISGPIADATTRYYYVDKSKTIKITLKNGLILEGTPEHPIICYDKVDNRYKWVRLQDIDCSRHLVPVTYGVNKWGNHVDLRKFDSKVLPRVPDKLSKELSYLVGYYVGDGCSTTKQFEIAMSERSIYSTHIIKIVKNLFGVSLKRYGSSITLCGPADLQRFMTEIIGVEKTTHDNISIPITILKAPKDIVAAFISGLFDADGYAGYNKDTNCIEVSITSSSLKLMRQLQILLLNFGITSNIKAYKRKATNSNMSYKTYYTLYVDPIYDNLVKFYRDILMTTSSSKNKKIRTIMDYTANFTNNYKYVRVQRSIFVKNLAISSKEYTDQEKKVYDFNIPKTHSFLSNGITSHNSAMLLSLLVKLITLNENVYAIYFTVDDPLYVTISRLIANISNLPINIVSNPNFKIIKANLPEEVKKDYIARREKALEFLRGKTAILNIKDSSEGSTIEAIVEKVKNIHPLAEHKQLIIFIDNLHNLRSEKYVSDRHLYSLISSELNNLSNMYKCPIIASTHVTKESMRRGEVDNTAIKETVELIYDAKLIMFLHSEEDLEESEVRDDIDIDIIISKNKFSAFKGKIPFRFYRSISKIEEVDANSESNELFT